MREMDVAALVGAIDRKVRNDERDGAPVKVVTATRSYRAEPEDVWDALTNPERIPRWFMPISGDLRPGGRFSLEGNASGEILECEPPRRLGITWEFGGQLSWVQVTLTDEHAGTTTLTLEHSAPPVPEWDTFGPGAVGVGWDLALLGLGLHLESGETVDPAEEAAFLGSPDGVAFVRKSSEGWGRASVASGEDEETSMRAAANTAAFYLGQEPPPEG